MKKTLFIAAVFQAVFVNTTLAGQTGWDNGGAPHYCVDESAAATLIINNGQGNKNTEKTYDFDILNDGGTAGMNKELAGLYLHEGQNVSIVQSIWGDNKKFGTLTLDSVSVADSGTAGVVTVKDTNGLHVKSVDGALGGANVLTGSTLTLGTSDSTIKVNGAVSNAGTTTLNGTITFGGSVDGYTLKSGNFSYSQGTQGFKTYTDDSVFYATSGTITAGDNFHTNATLVNGRYEVAGSELTQGKTFDVNNGTATLSAAETEAANVVNVTVNTTLTLDGSELTYAKLRHNNKTINLVLDNGATFSGSETSGVGIVRGTIEVKNGSTLSLSGQDALGYYGQDFTDSVTISGTESAVSKLVVNNNKVGISGDLNLNGNALVSGANNGFIEFYGGNINVSGTNNIISSTLATRGYTGNTDGNKGVVDVAAGGALTISGAVILGGDWSGSGNHAAHMLTKRGDGLLTITGEVKSDTANKYVIINGDGANTILTNNVKNAQLNNVTISKNGAINAAGTVDFTDLTLKGRINLTENATVTIGDMTFDKSQGYAFFINAANAKLIFNGTADVSGKDYGLGVRSTGTIEVAEGGNLTTNVVNAANSNSEGTVSVLNGGVFTASQNAKSYFKTLETAGTTTFSGLLNATTVSVTDGTTKLANLALADSGTLSVTGGMLQFTAAATGDTNLRGVTVGENGSIKFNTSQFAGYKAKMSSLTQEGTLILTGSTGADGIDLSTAWSGKAIVLNAVEGKLLGNANGNTVIDSDLVLENTTNAAAADWTALSGTSYVFNGSISDTASAKGNMVFRAADTTTDVTLNGSLAGWTAKENAYSGFRVCDGTVNLTIGGNLQGDDAVINNQITVDNVAKPDGLDKGTLNVTVERDATFNANLNAHSLVVAADKSILLNSGFNVADVTLGNSASLEAVNNVTISNLTLGANAEITVNNHNGTLTTSSLTVNGDSTMNADLVMGNGSTLTFAEGAVLTMGCDVTISGSTVYVTIDGTIDDMLAAVRNGNYLLLIDGLEEGDADAQALTLNTVYINDATDPELHLAFVKNTYSENGTYAIVVAPEPATATLSLLALAALASRRRRH